jgi:hypothetical protein
MSGPISIADLERFHRAVRMIEDDMEQAYHTCRNNFGSDVAGVLLVALLRQQLNDKKDQWPPPPELIEKVNSHLSQLGMIRE